MDIINVVTYDDIDEDPFEVDAARVPHKERVKILKLALCYPTKRNVQNL